jgi:hypothetical protein
MYHCVSISISSIISCHIKSHIISQPGAEMPCSQDAAEGSPRKSLPSLATMLLQTAECDLQRASIHIYIYIWCVYISSIHINHQSTSSTSSVIVSGASLIVSLSWKCCNIQSQTCQSRQSKWQDWNLQWKKTNSDGLHKFNAVDFSAIFWVWDFAWLSGTAPACLA